MLNHRSSDLRIPPESQHLSGLVLVAGSTFYEKAGNLANIRILRFLGDASYSIYIWHVAVATILQGLLMRLHLPLTLQIMLEGLGTIFVTCMIYISVERPITQLLRRRTPLSPSPASTKRLSPHPQHR
jgi:exopolysaccharide production protein ExoZ